MEKTVVFDSKAEMKKVLRPNEIRQIRVNDELYNIVWTGASPVYIFETGCPHMSYPLNKGRINPFEEVVCPWHSYRFSLKTGDESAQRCRPLRLLKTQWNNSGQLELLT